MNIYCMKKYRVYYAKTCVEACTKTCIEACIETCAKTRLKN